MPGQSVVIVNPKSAGGATARNWPALAGKLTQGLEGIQTLFTDRPGAGTTLAREALRGGANLVISVGGDGTHNEVANGFFDGATSVRPEAALGIIPAGTGGDFRRSFGWSTDPTQAIARIVAGSRRKIDIGRLTFTEPGGGQAVRHFVNIASFGIGGQVDDRVNRSSKVLGGKLSFQLASLRALVAFRDQAVRLSFDGGVAKAMAITSVAVCNGQFFGGGMWVSPKAELNDGLFDVTIWQGFGLTDFVLKSRHIYDGRHVGLPGTTTLKAKSVRAESDEVVLLDVDGEQPGRLPATFEIMPQALWIQG